MFFKSVNAPCSKNPHRLIQRNIQSIENVLMLASFFQVQSTNTEFMFNKLVL